MKIAFYAVLSALLFWGAIQLAKRAGQTLSNALSGKAPASATQRFDR